MQSNIAIEDAEALIHKKRAEYEASAEFQRLRDEGASKIAMYGLMRAAKMSQRGAAASAAVFIDEYGEGVPECEWWGRDKPRSHALQWSEMAHQIELEAFVVAGITELDKSPMTTKQIKRIVAMMFKRLSQQDKEGFIEWAKTQAG